jgi:hypothetical protein
MTWRALAVAIAAVLPMIASTPVRAFMIPPPALLQIRFDSVTDELTPGGRVAADRLAVRAARCSDGRLRVLIRHESGTRPAQVTARYGAVRQHLSRLGVDAIYVNRFVGNGEGASASSVWASVSSGDDMHCSQVDSPLLQSWAGQLARHAVLVAHDRKRAARRTGTDPGGDKLLRSARQRHGPGFSTSLHAASEGIRLAGGAGSAAANG